VARLVEALRYKPEDRGFDFRWCHWNFSLTQPVTDYQEYFLGGKGSRCIGFSTLSPSSADSLEIWEPQPPGTLKACNGIALPLSLVHLNITVAGFK